MFRAVRYEQRFGFYIEEGTLQLMSSAVDSGHMESVSGERWLHEIERVFDEPNPGHVLLRASELGLLSGLHPSLADDSGIRQMAEWDEGLVGRDECLAALFSPLSEADGTAVIQRLRLSGRWAMVARGTIDLREKEKAVRESAQAAIRVASHPVALRASSNCGQGQSDWGPIGEACPADVP